MPNLLNKKPGADNESDSLKPGQDGFDDIVNHLQDVEERGDYIADNLYDTPDTEPLDESSRARDDIQNKEENLNPPQNETINTSTPSRLQGLLNGFKNNGAMFSIAGLLLAGGIGGSVLLAPAALLSVLEKTLTNHNSNDTRANIMMRRAYVGGLLNGKDCKGGGIACKFTTMSEEQKKRWEKNGFKVHGEATPDGRFKPSALEFPDGTKVTTGKDFDAHASSDLNARKAANLVMNPRASTFVEAKSKFKAKVLSKLKLSIDKKMTSGTGDKEERTQAMADDMNSRTEAVVDNDKNSRIAKLREKMTGSSHAKAAIDKYKSKLTGFKGASTGADAVSFACTAYSLVRASIAGVKLYYYQDLIRFAIPWMQLAAQQYTYGDVDPELMDYAMSRLTWYSTDPNDASYNKTALDSNGMRSVLYGDLDKLTEAAKHYTTWYMTAAVAGSDTVKKIEDFAGGKENIRSVCSIANGVGTVTSVACLSNPISALGCAGVVVGLVVFGEDIVKYVTGELVDDAMKRIADADLTSDLKGVRLGDAISSGIGLLLLQKGMGSGMRIATSAAAVNGFISATDDSYYRYVDEIALDNARKNPFDINNSYSVASQLAVAFNQYKLSNNALFGNVINLLSVSSSSFTSLVSPQSHALYSQPSELNRGGINAVTTSLNRCEDDDLESLHIECEWQGKPILIVRDSTLKKIEAQADGDTSMIENVVNYMTSKNYINEDGSTKKDNGDTDYSLYQEYCTENRIYPLGVSDTDYSEVSSGANKKLAWEIGAMCAGISVDTGEEESEDVQTMLDNFFIYYNMCETQVALADNVDNCYSAAGSPTSGNGDACSLLNNPNIVYVHGGNGEGTKKGLKEICDKGSSVNSCGKSGYVLDQELMDVITTLSSKYKIYVNNFGFQYDRDSCDTGQHPRGKAVDLNGIEKLDGSGSAGGSGGGWFGINFSSAQIPTLNQYTTDWLAAIKPSHGGIGQLGCGAGFSPTFPANATNINGAAFFPDSCDHLHIDVRDRGDPSAL